MSWHCYRCGAEIEPAERVGRRDACAQCGGDLHCCRNCRFHHPGADNECRESQAERQVEKERGNFCEYFSFRDGPAPARSGPGAAGARAKLNNLFRPKPG